MDRRVAIGVGIAALACAVAAWISFQIPPAEPPDEEPEGEVREPAPDDDAGVEAEAPATQLPAIWGDDSLGSSSCVVTQPTRRVQHDFDDAGRLIRTRVWRRAAGDAELRPWEVSRHQHGADGAEVQVRQATRVRADDPYVHEAAPEEAWRTTEQRIEHRTEGEWLHQRVTDAEGVRERLFRLEGGRLALESPLRADDLLPESSRCQFDPEGRPLRHQSASGHLTEWRYDARGALAAIATRASTEAAPTEIPVTVGDDGALAVLLDRFEGDCAEVVFRDCSTVMASLPGPPLPEGLLPGTR